MTSLRRRIYLTFKYEGPVAVGRRILALPQRLAPEARRLRLDRVLLERQRRALTWARDQTLPVREMNPRSLTPGLGADAIETDLVFRDPATRAARGWLQCLQHAARGAPGKVGVVGGRIIDAQGAIAEAGLQRDRIDVDRFVSCYAGKRFDYGPAQAAHPVLAVGGDGMYVTRELARELGPTTVRTTYDAVDLCLRAWTHGYEVLYEPAAILELTSPGTTERGDAEAFWPRWRGFFDERRVDCGPDKLRIVYVTEGTGLWGGHRVVFDDMRGLAARGHDVSLFTLGGPPDWIDPQLPVRSFASYAQLTEALEPLEAIKVATWWRTARPVWRASVLHGIPAYFVQDIESSYYPDSESARREVHASYRNEFRYLTTSGWNRDRLVELGQDPVVISPVVDPATFHPLAQTRRQDMVLALARDEVLKRFDLTVDAWRLLEGPKPELCVFGKAPTLAPAGVRYAGQPTDAQLNGLLNECTVFVQTSAHEGFSLPPLEAMATGAAVVCTDAHGNRDYCVDGVNCLMPEAEPRAIAAAIRRLLDDQGLRERLGAAAMQTAAAYAPQRRASGLEAFMRGVARGARRPAGPRG